MLLNPKLFAATCCAAVLPFLVSCDSETSHDMHANHSVHATKVVDSVKHIPAAPWTITTASKNKHFDGTLVCDQTPFVGDFQSCRLELSQAGQAVSNASLAIDGGMRAHGHGLPTQPKLIAAEDGSGHYKIEGLKFSMTGEWTVGFLIKANDTSDQLIFDFTI